MPAIFASQLPRIFRVRAIIKTPLVSYRMACFSQARPCSRVTQDKPKGADKRPDHPTALTSSEIKQIKELLQKEYQIWEIALRIQRDQSMVIATVEADEELAGQVKAVKTGRWSELEDECLLKLIANRRRLDKESIARQLGRRVNSVAARLRKIAAKRAADLPSTLDEDLDNDLCEDKQAILTERLYQVIERLLNEDITPQWRCILTAKSVEDWVARLLPLIPKRVKHVLAAPKPPTASDLRGLGWQATNSMGVYAWILKPKFINPLRPESFIYVGSATKYGWGLSGRKVQHQRGKDGANFLLQSRIKSAGLGKKGIFTTLLAVEATSRKSKDVVETRYLVTFAEAIFTVWLGALSEGNPGNYSRRLCLRSICPWELDQISYMGTCSHNPLTKDVILPSAYVQQNLEAGAFVHD